MRRLAIGALLTFSLTGLAHAEVYEFGFTSPLGGRLDGAGSFVTGAPATDPGYFQLISLTFTSLRDGTDTAPGTLDTGSLIQTSFAFGAAYDPAAEQFISYHHDAHGRPIPGDTYGGGPASGSTAPNDFGPTMSIGSTSFGKAGVVNLLDVEGGGATSLYNDSLTITAQPTTTMPEPPSIVLLALSLICGVGAGLVARRR